jgi:hypothetical protein
MQDVWERLPRGQDISAAQFEGLGRPVTGDLFTTNAKIPLVEAELVGRAVAAATSLAGGLDLPVDEAVVVHNSNKLALRLLPCDAFARVARAGQEVLALEVELAQRLGALASPVAALEPRVDPRVYEGDGFALTFWSYYETVTLDQVTPAEYAGALQRLHAGMRKVEIAAPHFMERAAEALGLVASRDETPALADADRLLLQSTLQSARRRIHKHGASEQLLHGEPHPGNILSTQDGALFIDLETCCRGPIEFDLAHAPEDVVGHYPGVDRALLGDCGHLVLAMVAAWRWDAGDQFPDGPRVARELMNTLRQGPPWPSLDVMMRRLG